MLAGDFSCHLGARGSQWLLFSKAGDEMVTNGVLAFFSRVCGLGLVGFNLAGSFFFFCYQSFPHLKSVTASPTGIWQQAWCCRQKPFVGEKVHVFRLLASTDF